MGQKKNRSVMIKSTIIVALLILIDQITKMFAFNGLKNTPGITIINGVLELKYLENQSASFSLDPISLIYKIFHIKILLTTEEHFISSYEKPKTKRRAPETSTPGALAFLSPEICRSMRL